MNINDKLKEQQEQEEKEKQKEAQRKQEEAEAAKSIAEEMEANAPGDDDDDGLPEGPGFMALYTTLMLLLMTFFIVLCSMSASSTDKFKDAKVSINSTMNLMGLNGSRQVLYFMYSFLKIKNASVQQALELHDRKINKDKKKKKNKDAYWEDGVSKEEASQLNRFIALGFNIDTSDKEGNAVKVRFPEKGVFVEGTAEFDEIFEASFKPFLKTIGTKYDKMEVQVYCIEKPDSSTGFTTTKELAALRAAAVTDAIIKIQKVDRSVITPVGYGSYYYGTDNIPKDKKEMIELVIYGLWGEEDGGSSEESQTEDLSEAKNA